MKRILYISYFYPPLGGPAALRNVKTVKYLSQKGFDCSVITVGDIEYLYRDPELLAQSGEARIIRAQSLDPMALLKKSKSASDENLSRLYLQTPEKIKLAVRRLHPIDDKIGWVPGLIKAGRAALKEQKYDLIHVSLGPFSSALGAYTLSRESGIPLSVDFRDYWTLLSDYELQAGFFNRAFSRHWEKKILRHASLIVTATDGIGKDIAKAFGDDLQNKMLTVFNGWDEADFEDLSPAEKAPVFTFSYFGNIYARRSLKHFYAALKSLREEGVLPPETRIRLYGNFFREALTEIENSGIADIIEVVPQLSHREALAEMLAADALLLVVNSSSPQGTLTSKIFEYLRAQRPILAMVPRFGEAAQLLQNNCHDLICGMESVSSIRHAILRLLQEEPKKAQIPWELQRKNQVAKLAEGLRRLTEKS
ncbi:MAG: glycosyltransferase family 4 protein [Candidatus Cloacimonetes bacterium]|nr:glycosyltransferase family 4 protein [Candidatus Cloacimonadota bacterium]